METKVKVTPEAKAGPESGINWSYFRRKSWTGHLAQNIKSLSNVWNLQEERSGDTFMGMACAFKGNDEAVEMLLSQGHDFCNHKVQYRSIKVWGKYSPLEIAMLDNHKALYILLANGIRLSRLQNSTSYIFCKTSEMQNFERGVLGCVQVIVILLGLKKRCYGGASRILPKLDRFLIQQELAVAIWTTRSNESWRL